MKRAKFSNTERAYVDIQSLKEHIINLHLSHVLTAALNPINLDDRQVNAVAARIELDLRLGASFTRFQTLTLQAMGGDLEERVISYGTVLLILYRDRCF